MPPHFKITSKIGLSKKGTGMVEKAAYDLACLVTPSVSLIVATTLATRIRLYGELVNTAKRQRAGSLN